MKEELSKDMDKKKTKELTFLRLLTIIFGLVALIASIIVISNSIDDKIEKFVTNPQFIEKIAREICLPFMIFDEKDVIHFDGGAFTHIDTIKVNRNKKLELVSIDIFPKEFLNTPPILECWGFQIQFHEPVRIAPNGWKYSVPENAADVFTSSGTVLATKFKITLILNN